MTTDINSIENRNNILDFIIKREDQVNNISINDIGRNKYEDLFLYFYLKKYREDEGYILNRKQRRALKKLDALYKLPQLNSPYLSDFYTSFKNIYDIAKSYKEKGAADEDDDKIEKITDDFKQLYLLYNKDVYDDLKNDNKDKVFKYIEKKVKKYKGGDYSKFATNKTDDSHAGNVSVNFFDEAKKFSEKKSAEIVKKQTANLDNKNKIALNNMMYNIILKNLLFSGGNNGSSIVTVGEEAVSPNSLNIKILQEEKASPSAAAGVAIASASPSATADVAAVEVQEASPSAAAGVAASAEVEVQGTAAGVAPSLEAEVPATAAAAVTAYLTGGGDDSNKKTNEIIEILKDNKEKLNNINKKTNNINEKTKDLLNKYIKEDYKPYNNPEKSEEPSVNNTISYNIELFDIYDKEIDDLKNTKSDLDNYFKNIKTIYNNTIETIKGIDSNLLDARLKKYIKDINKFSLNDIDINNNIKEYDKIIEKYPKNKNKYEKTIKNLEDSIKHIRNKEIETEKAKQPSKRGGSHDNTLEDLIKLIEIIIKLLRNKIGSNNNISTDVINIDSSLFENIWSQYNKYVDDVTLDTKENKTTMDAEDNLYDQINMNNLNPADVLKINSKDKYVFCAVIFFIRLFIVIIVNLLIDNNIIKRLDTALITFLIAYVFIIIIIAIVVNLDTYKLRILLNYFNMNMNINLLILHLFIVIVFFILILIIVFDNEKDKYRNNFNSKFDYSYIYYLVFHLFNNNIDSDEVKNSLTNINISMNEKLKIQYKFEILTMIVYVFSSIIVLIS
mgnify:CR=1 FL=1